MSRSDYETKVQALADYLEVDVDSIEYVDTFGYGGADILQVDNGAEYFVGTEDECFESAVEDTINLIDDVGYDALNVGNSYLEIDEDRFRDFWREDYSYYVDDICYEDDRFREELIDAGIIYDDDERTNEELADDDDLKEELINYFVDNIDDYYEEYNLQFGNDDKSLIESGLIDIDETARNLINEFGVANELASYDGAEIYLGEYNGKDLYAYREQ